MRRICLLGPNSGIGKVILRYMNEFTDTKIIKVVRNITNKENEIFWDYQSSLPTSIVNADIVINCARSKDFAYNVRFNKILYQSLSKNTKFINFSSNCIYAYPNGWVLKHLFAGDAYIREKKAIEKMNISPNHFLIRPSIVLGESSWDEFKLKVKGAKTVFVPSYAKKSHLKVVTTEEVAIAVYELIREGFSKKLDGELYSKTLTINEFIDNDITFTDSKSIFFDNVIKNLLLNLLTLRFTPTAFVFYLQKFLISSVDKKNKTKNVQVSNYRVEGMTRLYICGKHTL